MPQLRAAINQKANAFYVMQVSPQWLA